MPPRRVDNGLAQIAQRLDAIEDRLTRIETGPHNGCPSPVLAQRVTALEGQQERTMETLQHISDKIDRNQSERFAQIEQVRSETRAMLLTAIGLLVPVVAGLLYIVLNHGIQ